MAANSRGLSKWMNGAQMNLQVGEEPRLDPQNPLDNIMMADCKQPTVTIKRMRWNQNDWYLEEYSGRSWKHLVGDDRQRDETGVPTESQWLDIKQSSIDWDVLKVLADEYYIHPTVLVQFLEGSYHASRPVIEFFEHQVFFRVAFREWYHDLIPMAAGSLATEDPAAWRLKIQASSWQLCSGILTNNGTLITFRITEHDSSWKSLWNQFKDPLSFVRRSGRADAAFIGIMEYCSNQAQKCTNHMAVTAVTPDKWEQPDVLERLLVWVREARQWAVECREHIRICETIRDTSDVPDMDLLAWLDLTPPPAGKKPPIPTGPFFSAAARGWNKHVITHMKANVSTMERRVTDLQTILDYALVRKGAKPTAGATTTSTTAAAAAPAPAPAAAQRVVSPPAPAVQQRVVSPPAPAVQQRSPPPVASPPVRAQPPPIVPAPPSPAEPSPTAVNPPPPYNPRVDDEDQQALRGWRRGR